MRRKADICIETKRKLGKILELTGESEQNLEIDRQKLCNCKSFEPYASFQRLDRSGKGFISCKDIQNFMRYAFNLILLEILEITELEKLAICVQNI